MVHNHGPSEGPGLACRERVVNGQLRGDCLPASRSIAAAAIIPLLVPIAEELSQTYNPTVADVRREAERRGILTGREQGRTLSFLPAVMQQAGLVPTDTFVRSPIRRSHGNLHRVWTRPN